MEEVRAHVGKLEVERDSLLSPYVLGRKAEQLGMGMADPGQVRRLEVPAPAAPARGRTTRRAARKPSDLEDRYAFHQHPFHPENPSQAEPARRRPGTAPRPSPWSGVDWQQVRFRLAAGLFAGLWVILWCRAFYVQLILGPDLETMAERQHSYTELVEARRGNIYDRNGQVLARSVECRSVYANPREVADAGAAAAALAPLLNEDPTTLRRRLSQDRSFVWLAARWTTPRRWPCRKPTWRAWV